MSGLRSTAEEHEQGDETAPDYAATVENQGATSSETEDVANHDEFITNEAPPIPPSEEEGAGNTDDTAAEQQPSDRRSRTPRR